ncbi:UDP-N-acetylglucosamine 1-carboxyvinyltransferase [Thermopetrobacter sp. TC1]|uniref:UDP-N-acetylglucosamine 1-carboxyvinyltransferase n=1 Tax=Thermopetrobacter sp. TC1 TaxID=1495045 RepID=UPI00057012AA|nr:UDP-N-acetylglucosamine 1-carboxyvinyltransferase [Thermopetrobacter sp. TC1]
MDKILIRGGKVLKGEIPISGAKNAALPLMIAALLTEEPLTLSNVPRLADVALLQRILRELGAHTTLLGRKAGESPFAGDVVRIHAEEITNITAPYELVSRMRASFWVIGPLLARCGQARVSLPGGCAIGTRPVDLYLKALSAMGAEIDIEQGYVVAKAPEKGLQGARIVFPKVSVGATHVTMMAAALARGETVIENAAREPEVADLARCLKAMGAKIEGEGTSTIHIEGVTALHGADHAVLPDRIETGTYAMAIAMTGGEGTLTHTRPDFLDAFLEVMEEAGVTITLDETRMHVKSNGGLKPVSVETQPYPGFPTDLQAQIMALMTMADGVSVIRETIFENRFMHVQELARLGADISLSGDTAQVRGVNELIGAPVMATDLRASVSLVIAGLAARGTTELNRVYHLDRGFEALEHKLAAVGADIERVRG